MIHSQEFPVNSPVSTEPNPVPPDPVVPNGAEANEGAAEPGNGQAATEPNRHAEAGRKGGQRFHELIQRGRQYEQEHGLKRGRQRQRQLIEEGKRYEEEHGLRPRRLRRRRPSDAAAFQTFCQSLLYLVKPRFRDRLRKFIAALEEGN